MTNQEPVTKRVHDQLEKLLVEMHGETLSVQEATEPAAGGVVYGFDYDGARCFARVVPQNERAAAVAVAARLGRLYFGYRRALRWLAWNRAGNSVAFSAYEPGLSKNELWVCTNRVTLPDDIEGMREMLVDVCIELERLRIGMCCWFPQTLDGDDLAGMERLAERDGKEALRAILGSPEGFYEWLQENPSQAEEIEPELGVAVMGWLGRWEEQLAWQDRRWEALPETERTPEAMVARLLGRGRTLAQLRRADEVLELSRQIQEIVDIDQWTRFVTLSAWALHALGRYDEVLEELREARFDANPRTWFWRSLAQGRLGETDRCLEAYRWYERGIGPDLLGRKMLREVLPNTE